MVAIAITPFIEVVLFSIFSLQEVLEVVDDLEVDIPKIWDFFAEIVTPALSDALSLRTFAKLLKDANLGNKAAKSMAR